MYTHKHSLKITCVSMFIIQGGKYPGGGGGYPRGK